MVKIDPDAKKPEGWDVPEFIPDPNAKKPEGSYFLSHSIQT